MRKMTEPEERKLHTLEIEENEEPPEAYIIKDKLTNLLGAGTIPWKLCLVIADRCGNLLLENHLYGEDAEEVMQGMVNPVVRCEQLRNAMDRIRRDDDELYDILGFEYEACLEGMCLELTKAHAAAYCLEIVKIIDDSDFDMALAVTGAVLEFYEQTIGVVGDEEVDTPYLELRKYAEGDADFDNLLDGDDDGPACLDREPGRVFRSVDDYNAGVQVGHVPTAAEDARNLEMIENMGKTLGEAPDLLSPERREELKQMYMEKDREGNRLHDIGDIISIAQSEMGINQQREGFGSRRANLQKMSENANIPERPKAIRRVGESKEGGPKPIRRVSTTEENNVEED
jgi:hypothetical protein